MSTEAAYSPTSEDSTSMETMAVGESTSLGILKVFNHMDKIFNTNYIIM